MKIYHKNRQADKIIVFFTGWGMDISPFQHIKIDENDYDFLFIYDYTNYPQNEKNLKRIVKSYKQSFLISWSFGVFMANQIFQNHKFCKAIACGGTNLPYHDRMGIHTKIFDQTMNNFSPEVVNKFYKNMCQNTHTFNFFKERMSKRSYQDQKRELDALKLLCTTSMTKPCIYQKAIIPQQDKIFSSCNQKRYWDTQEVKIFNLNAPHYCFKDTKNWQEFIF